MDTDALKPLEMDFKLAAQWEKASEEERNSCINRLMYEDACQRVKSWRVVQRVVETLERGEIFGVGADGANTNIKRDVLDVASKPPKKQKAVPRNIYRVVEKIVCSEYNLNSKEIIGDSRSKRNVQARHTIGWIMHREFGLSLTQIGKKMRRDHSSVLHGVQKIDRLPAHDQVKIRAIGLRDMCLKAVEEE